jgi:hypothetical protein
MSNIRQLTHKFCMKQLNMQYNTNMATVREINAVSVTFEGTGICTRGNYAQK